MNIYAHPEAYGLTVVCEADVDLPYEFDRWVCWVDAHGTYWWADDRGCSCPVPFDEVTPATMPSGSARDALTDLKAWMHGRDARATAARGAVDVLDALIGRPEAVRMWADRLTQHVKELEHQLMLCAIADPDIDDVVDRLDAVAHDMRQAADR